MLLFGPHKLCVHEMQISFYAEITLAKLYISHFLLVLILELGGIQTFGLKRRQLITT